MRPGEIKPEREEEAHLWKPPRRDKMLGFLVVVGSH